jgi:hypothetical protein
MDRIYLNDCLLNRSKKILTEAVRDVLAGIERIGSRYERWSEDPTIDFREEVDGETVRLRFLHIRRPTSYPRLT